MVSEDKVTDLWTLQVDWLDQFQRNLVHQTAIITNQWSAVEIRYVYRSGHKPFASTLTFERPDRAAKKFGKHEAAGYCLRRRRGQEGRGLKSMKGTVQWHQRENTWAFPKLEEVDSIITVYKVQKVKRKDTATLGILVANA